MRQILFCILFAACNQSKGELTVDELVKNADKYTGSTVTVRGISWGIEKSSEGNGLVWLGNRVKPEGEDIDAPVLAVYPPADLAKMPKVAKAEPLSLRCKVTETISGIVRLRECL